MDTVTLIPIGYVRNSVSDPTFHGWEDVESEVVIEERLEPALEGIEDFSHITAPGLVVAGDKDDLPLSTRGPAWTSDPYTLSRGNKSLLTVCGGEHFLGGISGYQVAETTDEDPARVALVQHVTLAQAQSRGDRREALSQRRDPVS